MVFGLKAKALIGIAVAAFLVASGWQSRAWYEDSVTLSVERALASVKQDNDESIAAIAKSVEQQLADTAVKERVIDRGIIRETSKVEYRDRECFGKKLVDLLNLGARGVSADIGNTK